MTELHYSFDLLYDIKTQEELQNEVDYLAYRLAGILELCRDNNRYYDCYVQQILGVPE